MSEDHVHAWGCAASAWTCWCGATSELTPVDKASIQILATRGDGTSSALLGALLDRNCEVERDVEE